ncbi:MAG: circularly permuted type 2 ATP-grasp protein [Myxococcales bacterium]|nr:circularly permuted type 2 ATP-grasp protein [Myxococcales bacterium]
MSTPASNAPPDAPLSTWAHYAPLPGVPDELLDADGRLTPHAQRFARAATQLGREELGRRWDRAQRELRENGVTYNVYDDSRGTDRPWQLDPIPLLITAAQWREVERGLVQRAQLLDRVLADIYGPQELLREGLLPPALVFGNPGFLRPCHGGEHGPQRYLHLYAGDLVRGPGGGFQVLGDRTQAPSGMGYALENRIVLSRAFPTIYRDTRVERLAPFFRALLDTISAISPRQQERPHTVLLTPGPYNETYFEHAYLARYLGLTLVEGGDLTVRGRVVYLKTLGGLQRVDVILRRVDDGYCDPLSLRSDSALGVAGLVSAVRAGNVALLNALGSGAVECPALMPFLPALSKRLLGEPLQLPSVPTHYCGDPQAVERVGDELQRLVIKRAYPRSGQPEPIVGASLDNAQRDALIARIRAEPERFVAQERVLLSTAPSWTGEGVEPRPLSIRSYVVSHGEGYRAMAGGLARVSHDMEFPRISMQHGAGSKDTWVLADAPVRHVSLLGSGQARLQLSRAGGDLPSRVADNLFWLGRYLERVEGTARLLRGLFGRLTDEVSADDAPELPALCHALAIHTELDARIEFKLDGGDPEQLERELIAFTCDGALPHALLSSMAGAYRAAFGVRERISGDTWRVLGQLRSEQQAIAGSQRLTASDALDALNRIVLTLAAFSGLQMESLSRTLTYRFVDMGRRLERATNTARLLWSTLAGVQPDEGSVLIAVLEVLDNAITYRRRYQGVIQAAPVLDLLLIDEANPRSVAFQLAMLHDHVQQLPRGKERPFRSREEQILLRALTSVRLADIEALSEPDKDGSRPRLDAHLQELMEALPDVSDVLTQGYLAHAIPQHSLGPRGQSDAGLRLPIPKEEL